MWILKPFLRYLQRLLTLSLCKQSIIMQKLVSIHSWENSLSHQRALYFCYVIKWYRSMRANSWGKGLLGGEGLSPIFPPPPATTFPQVTVKLIWFWPVSDWSCTFVSSDMPKQHVVNFLIRRRLALEQLDKKTVDIIPYLSSVPEESWLLVDKSKYTTFRHLVLSVPPYHLHSMFQNLAACILQKFASVSLGKYTLVSYAGQFHFRLDCGPCIVNRSVAEVRVTVRAPGQTICTKATEEVLSFLQNCIKELDHSYQFTVKVSCSVCRQYYVDLIEVQEAAGQGETERACGRCHGNQMSFSNLLNGFTESRPAPEFDWRPFYRARDPGLYVHQTQFTFFFLIKDQTQLL